jgi:hypothetical protein
MAGVLTFGRFLRARTDVSAVSSVIFIAKIGIVADAIFVVRDHRMAGFVVAILTSTWISLRQDNSYPGSASRVKPISTVQEWSNTISSGRDTLVLFVNLEKSTCIDFSYIFADMSSGYLGTDFALVDVNSNKDVSAKLKLSDIIDPVVIMFHNGKEIGRLPTEKNSKLTLSEKTVTARFFPK